jgi:hypothetical protein
VKLATEYRCQLGISAQCARGEGKLKRTRCAYCGGGLSVTWGIYTVQVWRGDRGYKLDDAVATYLSSRAAEAFIEREKARGREGADTWVVRFLTP